MPNVKNHLADEVVKNRLEGCTKEEAIAAIYLFGQRLLDEATERLRRIELKAASLAAYSGGVITILVSSAAAWSRLGTPATSVLIGLSAFVALIAAVVSAWAMKTRVFECVSDEEWLKPECLSDIHKLKRYWAYAMWGAMASHKDAQADKARFVGCAEKLLALSMVLLLAALFVWIHGPIWQVVRHWAVVHYHTVGLPRG